jgi:hypothetical protein
MLRDRRKYLKGAMLVFLASAILSVAGCSAPPEELTAKQVAALEQRARERWQALSARDYARVWEFGTPNYRSVFPKELYVLQFSYAVDRRLTGVEVVDYDAAAAVASVTARVMSKPLKQTSTASQALGALPVTVREKWMFIDGEWWFSADV